MVLRKLAKKSKLAGLGLAGLVTLGGGKTEKVSAQEITDIFAAQNGRVSVRSEENTPGFATDNGNLLRIGVYNKSGKWTNGSDTARVGVYSELGHGLNENCTVYAIAGAENVVFNKGVSDPKNPRRTFDISPNHFIPSAGVGIRFKKEGPAKNFGVYGGVEVCGVSEFTDYANWRDGSYSEILVDSQVHMQGEAGFIIRPDFLKNFNSSVFVGASLESSYAEGRVLTHNTDGEVEYSGLNLRNKTAAAAEVGLNYGSATCSGEFGPNGTEINLGFSKRF